MGKKTGLQLGGDLDLLVTPQRDANNIIVSGLNIGETLYQNQYIILAAQKGDLKEFPDMGVGIAEATNDNDVAAWRKKIYEELAKDGLNVTKVDLDQTTQQMIIIADYE